MIPKEVNINYFSYKYLLCINFIVLFHSAIVIKNIAVRRL